MHLVSEAPSPEYDGWGLKLTSNVPCSDGTVPSRRCASRRLGNFCLVSCVPYVFALHSALKLFCFCFCLSMYRSWPSCLVLRMFCITFCLEAVFPVLVFAFYFTGRGPRVLCSVCFALHSALKLFSLFLFLPFTLPVVALVSCAPYVLHYILP
jgi:hypothetical protein